jgi:argininosuccinate lyase
MSKKIWFKGQESDKRIEEFTVGKDRSLDKFLAPYDVLTGMAHVKMLAGTNQISVEEKDKLLNELKQMYGEVSNADFELPEDVEDIHSYVELTLTNRIGPAGKKLHIGRSRNDLVLTDLRMYIRDQLSDLVDLVTRFFDLLVEQSEKYKDIQMPGYTHMQIAMPSSFGLWFGAYAESLVDDLMILQSAYHVINKNPLGSAAGYGSSFPIDRTETTKLLGFKSLNYNSIYAQINRGKTERVVSQAIAVMAGTLGKLSMDCILYMGQNHSFISFPDELTTGSSIMPHKKNPDVWEIIRARCSRLIALPNEINMISHNLPSGYHRDLQLIKEHFMPALTEIQECVEMSSFMLQHVIINKDILSDDLYDNLYSVEVVQQLTQQGMTFRDAYREVAKQVSSGELNRPENITYTHEGSMDNLCNDEIKKNMEEVLLGFNFNNYQDAIKKLLAE